MAAWGRGLADRGIAGSLFAVAPALRPDAADALAAAGAGVHADIIIDAQGAHRGVQPEELMAVRSRHPGLDIDLHLIVDADSCPEEQLREALALAVHVGASHISLSADALRRHADLVRTARGAGVSVWVERRLSDGPSLPVDADGCLVMLIPPGTLQDADPAALSLVEALAPQLPTGVDGGVTREIALRSIRYGAARIVSGRALLNTDSEKGKAP